MALQPHPFRMNLEDIVTAVDLGTPWRVPSEDDLDVIAAVCAFLANLLLRIEAAPAAVAHLDADQVAAWPLAGRNEATALGQTALAEAVRDPAPAEELEADYRRLFVGPGSMLAPPWESVHLDEEGLMFQEQTMGVRHAYAEFGLQAPELNKEPDDHIGLELAFLGELAVAALQAGETGDVGAQGAVLQGMQKFQAEHLGRWAPLLSGLIIEGAQTQLYRAVGHLLAGGVEAFEQILAE